MEGKGEMGMGAGAGRFHPRACGQVEGSLRLEEADKSIGRKDGRFLRLFQQPLLRPLPHHGGAVFENDAGVGS